MNIIGHNNGCLIFGRELIASIEHWRVGCHNLFLHSNEHVDLQLDETNPSSLMKKWKDCVIGHIMWVVIIFMNVLVFSMCDYNEDTKKLEWGFTAVCPRILFSQLNSTSKIRDRWTGKTVEIFNEGFVHILQRNNNNTFEKVWQEFWKACYESLPPHSWTTCKYYRDE